MALPVSPERPTAPARIALLFAWVAAAVALAAIPVASLSYRFGLSPQIQTMFVSFRVALFAAAITILLALAALWLNRGAGLASRRFLGAAAPLVLALALMGLLVGRWDVARAAARIHDVTTDMQNPPAFEALLAERKATARNPAEYDPKTAPLQQAAYPDIKPVLLDEPPPAAFEKALSAAEAMGWAVAAADKAHGHIEATATTPWFRFKDDVVIRVTDAGQGKSRVDIRSVSRIGGSDLGQNAERIRAYVAKLTG